MFNNFNNPVKVDFLVFMYSEITKADHLLEPLRQLVAYCVTPGEQFEALCTGSGNT